MTMPSLPVLRTAHYLGARRDATSYARPWLRRPSKPSLSLARTRACHCLAARRAARAITRLYEEHLRPHGLRATQFSALSVLAERGPTPISTLADILGLERTTMTRSAALLERNGWTDTTPSDDARERRLRITEDGLRVLLEALPAWETAQGVVDSWPGVQSGLDEWSVARPRTEPEPN